MDALGPLDWQSEGTIPDNLCHRSKSAADAKDHSVKEGVAEAVVMKEDTRDGVDVGVGIFLDLQLALPPEA